MIGNYLPAPKYNKNIWHFLAERLRGNGWDVITTSSKIFQIPRLLDMLATIWRERNNYAGAQIDVFSGRAFVYTAICTWLLKKICKPFLLTLHGGGLIDFSKKHPKAVHWVLNSADLVVTPSPFLQTGLNIFRSDIKLILNPIDLSSTIFRIRKKADPKIIWVRAFHEVYNPSLAVKVIGILRSEFPGLSLVMVGPDKGDGSMKHLLNVMHEFGVDKHIRIVGGKEHTEIPTWLDKADIFINTTNYDTAPRSLLEAMGNGLCVVSTNVGGIPYIVDNGLEGLLVPPDQPEAMAAAIRQILNSPVLAEKLSVNARKKAEKYDWSHILPQWENLLSEVSHISD